MVNIKEMIIRPFGAGKMKMQWFNAVVTFLVGLALVKPFGFTLVNLSGNVLGTTWGMILGVLLIFIGIRSRLV